MDGKPKEMRISPALMAALMHMQAPTDHARTVGAIPRPRGGRKMFKINRRNQMKKGK